jgi:outer membrane lipoprotein-sorting protein
MKRILLFFLVFFVLLFPGYSQQIITAPVFFDQVAQNYSNIQDYIADIRLISGTESMRGTLYFRSPNLLRIDFSTPEDQVLVSNGSLLQVYVPRFNVILSQRLDPLSASSPGGLATPEGLALLRRNFSIAFRTGPDPEPLDEPNVAGGSSEPVVKLLLRWRNTNEGFREIELSITADQMIRRIIGITSDNRRVEMTFNDIRVNQNIPTQRFEFSSPGTANFFNNFLFGVEN